MQHRLVLAAMAPKIVVVGGAFGGLACLHHLCNLTSSEDCELLLIEPREYFEYTPGVLHSFVRPERHQRLIFDYDQLPRRIQHIQAYLKAVNTDKKQLQLETVQANGTSSEARLDYDFLVLATGFVDYSDAIIMPRAHTVIGRQQIVEERAARLAASETISIIGAGAVGVELAAELVERYPEKQVHLFYPSEHLLTEMPPRARTMAEDWLRQHGCHLHCNSRARLDGIETLPDGRMRLPLEQNEDLTFDLVLVCTGGRKVLPEYAKNSPALLAAASSYGSLRVNQHFQLLEADNIYACGDICEHPGLAVRTAQMANWGGMAVAQHMAEQLTLSSSWCSVRQHHAWPTFLGHEPSNWSRVYIVSLGAHQGIVIMQDTVMPTTAGLYMGGFGKWFIERTKVMESRGDCFGTCLWQIGDSIAACLRPLGF